MRLPPHLTRDTFFLRRRGRGVGTFARVKATPSYYPHGIWGIETGKALPGISLVLPLGGYEPGVVVVVNTYRTQV